MNSNVLQKPNVDCHLINVANKGDMRHMADFPYGMALITSYLRDQGFNTLMTQYPTWEKEKNLPIILDNRAYLYGFQVNFENYPEIRELVKIIKKNQPDAKIVFGGPFVVSLYEKLLRNDPDLDAIVLGEGEYTTAELVKFLKEGNPDWGLIEGLARLDEKGDLVKNHHRKAIQDLDAMPFAARDSIEEEVCDSEGQYMHDVRITTSRGCTSICTFCAVNINSQWQRASRWRGRGPLNVVDEIQELVENYNAKMINLQDSAFDDPGTLGPKRNRVFCEEIIRRGIKVSMKAYFRAHSVKEDPESIDLYKLYKEAGIDVLIIGAEAGSDYELELYKKDATLEDNYRSFRVLQDLDLFFVHIGFIMFGPYTTLPVLRQNLKFLKDTRQAYTYYNLDNNLMVTPGAAIEETLRRDGRLIPPEEFWGLPSFTFGEPRILKLARHYEELRKIFPHLDQSTIGMEGENIISRLKNKMNDRIAVACEKEIIEFKDIFYRNKEDLNTRSYFGFIENINRIEKDGLDANLMEASENYFGSGFAKRVFEMQDAYRKLVDTIKAKGFGLGGVCFDVNLTSLQQDKDSLKNMKAKEDLVEQDICVGK